jgi:hypothetical protein
MPESVGYPDMGASVNVAGFNIHNGERYVHLGPGGEAMLRLTRDKGEEPYISRANGRMKTLERDGNGMKFRLAGWTPLQVSFANAEKCTVLNGKEVIKPVSAEAGAVTFRLPEGEHALSVQCR